MIVAAMFVAHAHAHAEPAAAAQPRWFVGLALGPAHLERRGLFTFSSTTVRAELQAGYYFLPELAVAAAASAFIDSRDDKYPYHDQANMKKLWSAIALAELHPGPVLLALGGGVIHETGYELLWIGDGLPQAEHGTASALGALGVLRVGYELRLRHVALQLVGEVAIQDWPKRWDVESPSEADRPSERGELYTLLIAARWQ